MAEVGWIDILSALVIAPILVLPVFLMSSLVLLLLFDIQAMSGAFLSSIVVVFSCLVLALGLSRLYAGSDEVVKHKLGWLSASTLWLIFAFSLWVVGVVPVDVAAWVALYGFVVIAGLLLVVVTAVTFHSREGSITYADARNGKTTPSQFGTLTMPDGLAMQYEGFAQNYSGDDYPYSPARRM